MISLGRAGSAEPVGGVARFQTLVNHYRSAPKYAAQSELLTLFSGDAFNPSLESSVTKGSHMVPILNRVGTAAACVGVSVFQSTRNVIRNWWLMLDSALRTMIWTLGYLSSDIYGTSAHFPGSSQTCWIQAWAKMSVSETAPRRSY